jgi:hypothetical protein
MYRTEAALLQDQKQVPFVSKERGVLTTTETTSGFKYDGMQPKRLRKRGVTRAIDGLGSIFLLYDGTSDRRGNISFLGENFANGAFVHPEA